MFKISNWNAFENVMLSFWTLSIEAIEDDEKQCWYKTVTVKNLDQKNIQIVLVVCFSLLHQKGWRSSNLRAESCSCTTCFPFFIVIHINNVTAGVFTFLGANENLFWHHQLWSEVYPQKNQNKTNEQACHLKFIRCS